MTSTKSAEAISPLRRRMIEDMCVRKFSAKTRHDYIRYVESFAKFLGRSPDTATGEDLRGYQVHQTESGVQPPAMNSSVAALRFFFKITLGRADLATQLARIHYPRRLPRVLSPEDVGRLLEAAPGPGLKYKAALSVAYGAGLRASEVVALTVSDIDSKRMLIRVEQGKSLPPRRRGAARTGTPCSRHGCSKCCARGGGSADRRDGCSRRAIRSCPLRRGSSTAPAIWRLRSQGSGLGSLPIRCGTASQPIFSRPVTKHV
jgi:integrase